LDGFAPFSGRASHPLKAPGLTWRTKAASNIPVAPAQTKLPCFWLTFVAIVTIGVLFALLQPVSG
jgi:hypothetical protein